MATEPTLYFGYGSNLWLEQMAARCPTSVYRGVALIPHWQWIINGRGYANIVTASSDDTGSPHSIVYGLVFALQPEDEARLDVYEGVAGGAYEKQRVTALFWPAEGKTRVNTSVSVPESREMLVYVDRKNTQPYLPRTEYIRRMNNGIADAMMLGVPAKYIQDVMRPFILPDGEYDENGNWILGPGA
ncbi:hypothetical protein K488DRAFT_83093 [Vararia minispora EC-137]|uniref:Uncharacterized protein n=1 Tax=Vararia minispora EC-137 TaxID=1314806 RepID=A0ACB8QV16_9AGAM|nr:hypothetical protein K488DRAFT_83093 [Vararia minispora EC-137]